MHVFLSDTHLTDQDLGSPVSDDELVEFAGALGRLCQTAPVTLVLLGDVVDLLRSEKWEKLWDDHKSTPWSGMNPGFTNFSGNYAEGCAVAIAKAIAGRYQGFAAKLKEVVAQGRLTVLYVTGNHDFMAEISPAVQAVLREFFSLAGAPQRQFQKSYIDTAASLYATHGHSFDPINWHRIDEGYWAFGDAVVLRIVNRFGAEACRELGCAPTTPVGRQLHELDNIESEIDIPVYVRWLTDVYLTNKADRDKVDVVWKRVVKEFLDDPIFQDPQGYSDAQIQTTRSALKISRSQTLLQLVSYLQRLLPTYGVDYRLKAQNLLDSLNRQYRFIVFGHTHHPMLVPFAYLVNGEPAFYVNTGCWRRVVMRPSRSAPGPFVGRRVASYFRVDDPGQGGRFGRYHLHQQCHAT